MGTITGYTAQRMKAIEDGTIVSGSIDENGDLILVRFDGVEVNAGQAKGDPGPAGVVDLAGYTEPYEQISTASGTVTLDFGEVNVWNINPSGAITFAFANLPGPGTTAGGTIRITSSAHAITWPAGTLFPGGTPPELDGATVLSLLAFPTFVIVGTAWAGIA